MTESVLEITSFVRGGDKGLLQPRIENSFHSSLGKALSHPKVWESSDERLVSFRQYANKCIAGGHEEGVDSE